ncbi:transposase [Novosphingobium capsulatum]|uniref:Transposase n=1 Tax=Novosphingobium capsulatum TaxID=13688 RepID=A0ABU1MKU3_9SPHN|nr:transposase [Novosphingobium capsulatum]
MIDLPEQAPDAFLADKGYDADAIRADLAERKIKAVIPGRSNRRVKIEYDRALYKQRNRIECMFGHLKINRAIATRYDQLANSFLGMVHLATTRYWLKFVHSARLEAKTASSRRRGSAISGILCDEPTRK